MLTAAPAGDDSTRSRPVAGADAADEAGDTRGSSSQMPAPMATSAAATAASTFIRRGRLCLDGSGANAGSGVGISNSGGSSRSAPGARRLSGRLVAVPAPRASGDDPANGVTTCGVEDRLGETRRGAGTSKGSSRGRSTNVAARSLSPNSLHSLVVGSIAAGRASGVVAAAASPCARSSNSIGSGWFHDVDGSRSTPAGSSQTSSMLGWAAIGRRRMGSRDGCEDVRSRSAAGAAAFGGSACRSF